jgi:hypothetical protein
MRLDRPRRIDRRDGQSFCSIVARPLAAGDPHQTTDQRRYLQLSHHDLLEGHL